MTARDRALFTLVGPREAEHAAMRSGYSYGRATLRAFCRHRTALAMAILMAALILYALVQPLLPGQHPPSTIYNDAETGLQLRNLPPCRAFHFPESTYTSGSGFPIFLAKLIKKDLHFFDRSGI